MFRRLSIELANKKFCARQKSSMGRKGLPSSWPRQRTSNHPQWLLRKSQSFRHGLMLSLWSGMHCIPVPQCRVRGWGVVLLDSKTSHQSHIRCPGSCGMDEPTELRVAQCNRVWRSHARGKDWWSLGARCFSALNGQKRPPRGPNRHFRRGLIGVRVGEASHPGRGSSCHQRA